MNEMTATRVKICGITCLEDALCAVEAGADALGFVFYDKSPRCLSAPEAGKIVASLPPFVTTVGLFVNEAPDRVRRIMTTAGLQVVQLHGDESPADCGALAPWPVIKALRVRGAASLEGIDDYPVRALLLDAWSAGGYGGSGERFDWDLLAGLKPRVPLILAGGLNPDNVAEAVARVRPYAVDVSSGVEKSPGRKDRQRIINFIKQVKNR